MVVREMVVQCSREGYTYLSWKVGLSLVENRRRLSFAEPLLRDLLLTILGWF